MECWFFVLRPDMRRYFIAEHLSVHNEQCICKMIQRRNRMDVGTHRASSSRSICTSSPRKISGANSFWCPFAFQISKSSCSNYNLCVSFRCDGFFYSKLFNTEKLFATHRKDPCKTFVMKFRCREKKKRANKSIIFLRLAFQWTKLSEKKWKDNQHPFAVWKVSSAKRYDEWAMEKKWLIFLQQ